MVSEGRRYGRGERLPTSAPACAPIPRRSRTLEDHRLRLGALRRALGRHAARLLGLVGLGGHRERRRLEGRLGALQRPWSLSPVLHHLLEEEGVRLGAAVLDSEGLGRWRVSKGGSWRHRGRTRRASPRLRAPREVPPALQTATAATAIARAPRISFDSRVAGEAGGKPSANIKTRVKPHVPPLAAPWPAAGRDSTRVTRMRSSCGSEVRLGPRGGPCADMARSTPPHAPPRPPAPHRAPGQLLYFKRRRSQFHRAGKGAVRQPEGPVSAVRARRRCSHRAAGPSAPPRPAMPEHHSASLLN